MRNRNVLLFVVLALLILAPNFSDAQEWKGRLRLISVMPNDDSTTIADTGTGVTVDDAITLEADLTYMFNDNWGVEVIAGTTEHDLDTKDGALGGADAGSVGVLPPTITLQYFFNTSGGFHPYMGVGVNFTLFYSYDLSEDLAGLGVSDIDFDSSFGFAGNLGFDVDIDDRWLFNIDLKYITISTDAEIQLDGGGVLDTLDVDIDPWVIGIGFGYRF